MAAKFWKTSTINAFNTTLNGGVSAGDASITLSSVLGLQSPGVIVIDRVDSNGVSTPTTREYISFTGIAGSALTGCVRGLGGSSDQAHNSGAKVEEAWSITHWNDFGTLWSVGHDSSGNNVFPSTVSFAQVNTDALVVFKSINASNASTMLKDVLIWNSLNLSGASTELGKTAARDDVTFYKGLTLSGASVNGNFGVHPTWVIGGAVSLATTFVGKPLPMPMGGAWRFFSMVLRTPANTASLLVDINKNGVSIFTDQNTRLVIPDGGTYVSTASIGTKSFVSGDIFSADIDVGAGNGADLTILGRGL